MKRRLSDWFTGLMTFMVIACPTAPTLAAQAPAPSIISRPPRLFPDYADVVVPPNIAPLNFRVEEPGRRYRVRARSTTGSPILLESRQPVVRFPPKPWHALLQANAGAALCFEISLQDDTGTWHSFSTVTNTIAREPIDPFLAYRRLGPLFNLFTDLGLYQRDLTTSTESVILRNSSFDHGCLNCHTVRQNDPSLMLFHIRHKGLANPVLLVQSNTITRLATTGGYSTWHPSGRLVVWSANKLSMFFHTIGESRDVLDAKSDLRVYRVDSNLVVSPPAIARPDRQETWPSWSPDGRFLYFCAAPVVPAEQFRQIRYDLQRVPYDLEHDTWGEVETLAAAADTGLSAAQPRVSPDGKWLVFCLFDYGNFPVYRSNSDLYAINLQTRERRRLDAINTDQVESWHSWSSNSRWLVFSSKRLDKLFSRPHFTYVDDQGVFHKPFLLPQVDPAFYDTDLKNYNLPELLHAPVRLPPRELAQALSLTTKALVPKTDAPPTPASSEPADGQPEYQPGGRTR